MTSRLLRFTILLTCMLAATSAFANTCKTCYVDYQNGNDTWDGTSKTNTSGSVGPWKHAPGMLGLNTSGGSTGDGCTGNCASQVPVPGDSYILRGGVVWPYTTLPWQFSGSGSASTQTFGCAGTGCIYIGIDPTWNLGIVNSITLSRDLGGCTSAPTVSIIGGGGSGATATAAIMPSAVSSAEPNVAGFVLYFTVTNQGSGYTSNPAVSVSGGGCTGVTAVADITRPVIDAGLNSGIAWPVGSVVAPLGYGPGLLVTGAYVIVDHLEYRNILQLPRGTGTSNPDTYGSLAFISDASSGSPGNVTISNNYVHHRNVNSCLTGCPNMETGDTDIALAAYTDEVANNVVSNTESIFVGSGATNSCPANDPCQFSAGGIKSNNGGSSYGGGGSIHGNKIIGVRWQVQMSTPCGTSPSRVSLVYGNEAWLAVYDILWSGSTSNAHGNEFYFQMCQGTLYEYNNVMHSNTYGAGNQQQMGNGTTQYFFNNVMWGMGGSTPDYGIDASNAGPTAGGKFYFYNNTLQSNTNVSPCINSNSGSYNSLLVVILQNNDCITNYGPPYWSSPATGSTWENQAGSTAQATVQASSTVTSWSAASSQGYTLSNLFAPTTSASDTVAFSSLTNTNNANLTGLCTGYLVSLCSDIYGNARPTTGPWNAGAFLYTGKPVAPAQLATTVNTFN